MKHDARALFFAALLCAPVVCWWWLGSGGGGGGGNADPVREWFLGTIFPALRAHLGAWWSAPLFAAVHAAAVLVCFPGTLLFELCAGLLFGVAGGAALVVVAKTVGAGASLLAGRTFLRAWVARRVARLPGDARLARLLENVAHDSWRVCFLLRLSPVPSWANNYALALTDVPYLPFLAATAFGNLPMILNNVYVGSLVQDLAGLADYQSSGGGGVGPWLRTAYLGTGIVSTALVARLLVRYASAATAESASARSKPHRE